MVDLEFSIQFSKLEFDLPVYSATSGAKDDDLSSSNFVGESYSSISPTPKNRKSRIFHTNNVAENLLIIQPY